MYVLYDVGPAHNEIKVLARGEVTPQELVHRLEYAVEGTGFAANPIKSYSLWGFTVARARFSRSKLFVMSASTTAPVGRVISRLKESGLKPHALLIVPVYADAPVLNLPHRQPYPTWYDASNAPADLAVTVKADMPVVGALLNLAIAVYVPALYLLSIPAMKRFGSEEGIPDREHEIEYRRRTRRIMIPAIVGYLGLGYVDVESSAFGKAVDLWMPFSTPGVAAFLLLSLFALVGLGIVLGIWQPRAESSDRKARGAAGEGERRDAQMASAIQLVVAAGFLAFGNALASARVVQWAWTMRAIGIPQAVLAVVRLVKARRR